MIKYYKNKELSIKEIAKIYKCNEATIFYYFKKYKIKTRTRSEANKIAFFKGKHPNLESKNKLLDKNPNWNGGSSFEPYPTNWTKQIRDLIRVRDNFICQLCGVPELECNRRLRLHQIDYDKNNIKLDNLISLCVDCHMKTNSNREKWTTYFQNYIKENKI